MVSKAEPKSLEQAYSSLTFAPDRTPTSTDIAAAFCELAPYRNGAVFLGHWAGRSEWEVHHSGDELVMVVDGATTMTLIIDGEDVAHTMTAGQLIVVPAGTWHRFETPDQVKVMTVTPQPTQHSVDRPGPVDGR